VDIHSLAGLASLFGDAASGHALKSVELAGVKTIKDKSTTVYDVKLSEVLVSSFKNDPGSQGVETELALNFSKIVNGTLNLTQACRYRHFEPDPPASSVCPRSREQCGQMFSSLSFALLGRAMMPARRLSLSR
jgi:hypothetical protein